MRFFLFKKRDKRGIVIAQETIGWWVMALLVLAIMLGGYFYLKTYLEVNIIEYLKNIFRFRGI